MGAVREIGDASACPPLGVRECLVHPSLEQIESEPARDVVDAGCGEAVCGELRAQVGDSLSRLAHCRDELREKRRVQPPLGSQASGRDDDSLLLERGRVGGHASGSPSADVRMMSAVGGKAEVALADEERRHQRDVREMRPAAVGIVQDPRISGAVVLRHHGGYRLRHRAEVHWDVLRLHDHLPAGIEQGGRGVAAFLDVRRMRSSHESGAHLFAHRAQRPR